MEIVNVRQGSPEWLAYRASHFNASDAPAMMGVSPYKTRAQLLRELHTGVVGDVDIATQKRFDNGHRAEALARPLAEEIVGSELYPVTGSLGRLSASFDGLTLDETEGFEHKAMSAELKAAFAEMETMAPQHRERSACRSLPAHHRIQVEQQLFISGAERILFMASEWTPEGELVEERHCWYCPDLQLRQQILDGWAQFERDLAAYVLPEAEPPAPVGRAPETLPALHIEVTGAVTASNLAEFKATALATIRSVNRTLATDQDFADAEKAVKWCADVESRVKAAKEHALAQTASIDALFKTLDDISAEARAVRLDLDKLVTRRKVEVKEEAVAAARRQLDDHIAAINGEIAPFRVQVPPADFAGAIKGLKSLSSIQDKLGTTVAAGKIAADAEARVIRANVSAFKDLALADDLGFLFPDLHLLVRKAADDFGAAVRSRIAQHRAAEEARESARKKAEAERIAAAEQRAREEAEKAAAQAVAMRPAPAPISQAYAPQQRPMLPVQGPAPVAPAPRPDEPATLKLGTICERLGFTVSAAFLADVLHIKPAKAEGASKLYTERQFSLICRQLQSHVSAMAELYASEATA
jgi:putative phage-type endonuclease